MNKHDDRKQNQGETTTGQPLSIGALLLIALLIVGCQPIVAPIPSPDSITSPQPTPVAQQEESPMSTPADANAAAAPSEVEMATADLAARLAVDANEIEVISVQSVDWRDGSLGCPEPGMMYAQVIVPGMRIVLAVDGQEYEYHSGRNRDPFLCEEPEKNGSLE